MGIGRVGDKILNSRGLGFRSLAIGSLIGWGGVLFAKEEEFASKITERLCRYASGLFKVKPENLTSIDCEVLAVTNALKSFSLFLSGKYFAIRTDCQAIVAHINSKDHSKSLSS
ncbi:hypothetical protein Q3G72_012069 [Acer saccharum]|nr:hypothetical protein Q3G72_012069 [Acer saccharum]